MTLIRAEHRGDEQQIHALIAQAFAEAEHRDGTEQDIVDLLRKDGALTVSCVAEVDGEIVGHVAASPVSISDGTRRWFGIGPLAVLPQNRRQGIGNRLMRRAIAVLKQNGAAGCVLLGDPGYYSRFGFRNVPDLVLPDVPPRYFQSLTFGASFPKGTVCYHAAFAVQRA